MSAVIKIIYKGFNVHWVAFILTFIWLAWVYGIVGGKIRRGPLIVKGKEQKNLDETGHRY